ncbi:unnamed protein product [Cunninghamella echinulata]
MKVQQPTLVQKKSLPILLGPSQYQHHVFSQQQQKRDQNKKDVDAVIQAQTGSGKTLTYLLPIVQRLVTASTYNTDIHSASDAFGDRNIGTLAIILTPTRELAQQVTSVLQQVLTHLSRPQDAEHYRRLHWIVTGMVIGGDNKSKEKARLRKGVTLLVSTPGRLLDHLQNTKSFDIKHLKWLVLDEADRLLDLGFEETLKKIMDIIQERTSATSTPLTKGDNKSGYQASLKHIVQSGIWPKNRQTILCSATLRDDVKQLAGTALVNPVFVRGSDKDDDDHTIHNNNNKKNKREQHDDIDEEMKFSTPNQLQQTYTITPAKLRLVTLIAMLQHSMKQIKKKPSKVIVFFSCCDSVDFHYDLFAKGGNPIKSDIDEDRDELMAILDNNDDDDDNEDTNQQQYRNKKPRKTKKERQQEYDEFRHQPSQNSKLLNGNGDGNDQVSVFRLHGDLEQSIRTSTFTSFSKATSGVLLCTDVAARGLDLPNVDRIIQYDPPTDMKDYVHRVGRTARLGKAGEAVLFLLPSEMDYLPILKAQNLTIQPVTSESVLAQSFGKVQHVYESKAQEIQNQLEKYILSEEEHLFLARKAFWSSVRAYATHAATEKHVFHIKKLHLGHLAKSFGLREAPSHLQDPNKTKKKKDAKQERMPGKQKLLSDKGKQTNNNNNNNNNNQQKQQQHKKRKQYDQADEFAIATSGYLTGGPTTKKKRGMK